VSSPTSRPGSCHQAGARELAHAARRGASSALPPSTHSALRAQTTVPIAVGFGVRDHRDVRALAEIGPPQIRKGHSKMVTLSDHTLATDDGATLKPGVQP
jgi:hypothetical protein